VQNVSCVPRGTLDVHEYALNGPDMFHMERSVFRGYASRSCKTYRAERLSQAYSLNLNAMAFQRDSVAEKEKSVPRGTHAPSRLPAHARDVGSELADSESEKT
jgi:hypothetical protein